MKQKATANTEDTKDLESEKKIGGIESHCGEAKAKYQNLWVKYGSK